jgi:hypothetical protein
VGVTQLALLQTSYICVQYLNSTVPEGVGVTQLAHFKHHLLCTVPGGVGVTQLTHFKHHLLHVVAVGAHLEFTHLTHISNHDPKQNLIFFKLEKTPTCL